MAGILVWIVLLEYVFRSSVSEFAARKLCHAGCGAGIMILSPASLYSRLFVWSVAAGSIAMTWNLSPIPAFRFSRPHDVGVTAYLCLVSLWFYLRLPPLVLVHK